MRKWREESKGDDESWSGRRLICEKHDERNHRESILQSKTAYDRWRSEDNGEEKEEKK